MNQPLFKVIIVGASIEGLTLAHCLQRAQIGYLILERNNDIVSLEDGPVIIMPNAARIWDQLGLWESVKHVVEQIDTVNVIPRDTNNYALEIPQVLEERLGYHLGFARKQQLLKRLYNLLPRADKVKTNKRVVRIDHGINCAQAVTWDGYVYEGDLVVGADGGHSKVRAEMARLSELPELAVDADKDMTVEYACLSGTSSQWAEVKPRSATTTYGNGRSILCLAGSDRRTHWLAFMKLDRRYAYASGPQFSAKEIERQGSDGQLEGTVCGNATWDGLWRRRESCQMLLVEEGMRRRWYWKDLVCIGGSMHQMAPHTGQNTSCSVEDAAELANVLYQVLKNKPQAKNIEIALSHFSRSRVHRITPICRTAKRALRHYALDGAFDGVIARYCLPRIESQLTGWVVQDVTGGTMLEFVALPRVVTLPSQGPTSSADVRWLFGAVAALALVSLLPLYSPARVDYKHWL